jgi:hypothetical protein
VVAAAGHCGNVPGCLRRIAQHPAEYTDGVAHDGICDRGFRPDGVQEFVFGNQTIWVGHQIVQHIKGFGRQDRGFNTVPQAGVGRVEPKGTKDPLRGGGHSSSPRLLALLATEGTFHDFITFLRHFYDIFTVLL